MAGLDDLFAQIPVQDIASKLGADQGEVDNAIKTLVPALVGGLAQNVQSDDIDSSKLESAVAAQGASGLLDGGVNVDQVDQKEGDNLVASLFGGNDSNAVASALAGTGAGGGDLIKRLLPILAPPSRSRRRRRSRPVAAASATSSAASSAARAAVAAQAAGTTRWAASWAASSAAARATRSVRSSAACSAARSRRRQNPLYPGQAHRTP
jgi:hypothetical protein